MTRRPLFWVVFAALGVAGAVAAVRLFTVALPVVSLDVEMDREQAMAAAADLAERYGWGPDDARAAASFGQVDPEVQTYVELEGGGRGAFQELMDAGVYHPYQWRVRRFAEGEVEEVQARFAPAGTPLGFRLTLAEDDAGGGNLDDVDARAAAESAATEWGVDLASYTLIESSEREMPGGRVDHTFVYQRGDVAVAEARFRLRLVVAGDGLGELTHFVFVPEAFSRRYADMRSTNDAIALVAQSFVMLVYVLLGAGLGTALLLRRRWVEWKTPLAWGAVVATLVGLNTINELPLAWMGYDTAISVGTFVLRSVAFAGAGAVLGTPLLAFVFLAGESLGRRAFPAHLQQWRFWSPDVAASKPALGLTVAAYLLVGLQVGYVVLFYLGTARLQGWWSPADALVQPDLLAAYLPWLQAVSLSLFASFWEESVFRAVPIACAALLGARFGRRGLWIWSAVVLQALVFAAGHANYPQQPPYARVVELWLPAFAWGVVYVRYGLVPTVLAHFLYDLALFSSVLFTSGSPVDRGVILAVAAVPLAIVLRARSRGRAVDEPPAWAYNGAWSPGDAGEAPASAAPAPAGTEASDGARASGPSDGALGGARVALPPRAVLGAVSAVGVALWVTALALRPAPPRLELTRGEAVSAARVELVRLGLEADRWTASATTGDGRGAAHSYVWEEAGPDAFDALLGSFLAPPQWIVRFVDWSAEPAERVEEIVVNIEGDGSIRHVAHALPEGRAGAALAEDSARVLARAALPAGDWAEIGAEEDTHESRTDWTFTFRETGTLTGVAGEARASVAVLGDEVTDFRRYVQVPEEWERARRAAVSRRDMVSLGLALALGVMFVAAAITAIVVWSRRGLRSRPLVVVGLVTGVAFGLASANGWPAATAFFSTAQPYELQAGGVAFGFVLLALVAAGAAGLVAALGHSWARHGPGGGALAGTAAGLGLGGATAVAGVLGSSLPALPGYGGAAEALPMLSAPVDAIAPWVGATAALLVLAAAHRRWADHPMLRSLTVFAILALGVITVPGGLQESLPTWIGGAAVAGGLAWLIVRLVGGAPAAAPTFCAAVLVMGQVEVLLARPYPGSGVGSVLAAMVIATGGWVWARALEPASPSPTPASAAPPL